MASSLHHDHRPVHRCPATTIDPVIRALNVVALVMVRHWLVRLQHVLQYRWPRESMICVCVEEKDRSMVSRLLTIE